MRLAWLGAYLIIFFLQLDRTPGEHTFFRAIDTLFTPNPLRTSVQHVRTERLISPSQWQAYKKQLPAYPTRVHPLVGHTP